MAGPRMCGRNWLVEVLGASGHAQQPLAEASLALSSLAITRRAGGPPFVRCLWGWEAHTAPEVQGRLAPLFLLPTFWHFKMLGLWQAGVPSGPQPITSFCFKWANCAKGQSQWSHFPKVPMLQGHSMDSWRGHGWVLTFQCRGCFSDQVLALPCLDAGCRGLEATPSSSPCSSSEPLLYYLLSWACPPTPGGRL